MNPNPKANHLLISNRTPTPHFISLYMPNKPNQSIRQINSKRTNQQMHQRYNHQTQDSQDLRTHKNDLSYLSDQSRELDIEYLTVRQQVLRSHYYLNSSKHTRIRLNSWLQKLDQIIANPIWKRNRNSYVKLINLMCECETVVGPFTALPPQADVPKLNKHQINHIIDEVERVVKAEQAQSKGSLSGSRTKPAYIKPEDHWHRIRNQKQVAKSSSQEEGSIFLGRFTNNTEKSQEEMNLGTRNAYYSMAEEGKESKMEQKSNIYYSNSKDQENAVLTGKVNGKVSERTKGRQRCSKHIVVKIIPQLHQIELAQTSKEQPSKSLNYISEEEKQNSPYAFRDPHISIQLENQTLKTQLFDQDLSIHHPQMHDFSQISFEQCDFTEDLSERCRTRDEILNHSYFTWRNKQKQEVYEENPQMFEKKIVNFTEMTPLKQSRGPTSQSNSINLVTATKQLTCQDEEFNEEHALISSLQGISLTSQHTDHGIYLKDITGYITNQQN